MGVLINKSGLRIASAVLIAIIGVSCAKVQDPAVTPDTPSGNYITACQGTKVGFDEEGVGYWHVDDAIGLLEADGTHFTGKYVLADGDGEAQAEFWGTAAVTAYATCPYNEKNYLEDDGEDATLIYNLPAEYTLSRVNTPTSYENKLGTSFNMPMFGSISTQNEKNIVRFKNIGAVIVLNIDYLPTEAGKLTVTSSENNLCGNFSTDLSVQRLDNDKVVSEAGNSVTFNYSGAEGKHVWFYLPVAAGTYTLSISLNCSNGMEYTYSLAEKDKTFTIGRSNIKLLSLTCNTTFEDHTDGSKTINGHKFVNLGLTSGTLWAETNVGASESQAFGNYYAWGDKAYSNNHANWNNYCHYDTSVSALKKYIADDGKTVLELEDDPAYQEWGSCKTPSLQDFYELKDECTWTWESGLYNYKCGYRVTSKKNGNSIFLAAGGAQGSSGDSYMSNYEWGVGDYCIYWTCDVYTNDYRYAYSTCFHNKDDQPAKLGFNTFVEDAKYDPMRYCGAQIRPVVKF